VSGVGVEEAAIRALTTVRQVMPARLRHRLNAIKFTALPTRSQGTVHPDVLVAVSSGIRSHEVLRFDYESSRERGESVDFPAARRVEPHYLVSVGQRWYLVAWDLDRGDWRTFRADRITPRIPTGPRSTPREIPGGSVGAFVAARFVGADVGSHWPCQGTVILGMPASAVAPFAGDGTVEDLGEGRCRFESGSWSWIALAASLGRFDANIEVVGPPELAAAFQQLATRYATAASSLPRRDH
ncbi:MAG TPA: WYL domain-containing protein, partial [Glaciihabitans sp.]|nr:WYL domain-containing protein [Glaciihabitans sp.]